MKTNTHKILRFVFTVSLALVIAFATSIPARAVWYPGNITALGDSITTAYDSAGYGNQLAYSWSTGTNKTVNSMYLRILAVNRKINGKYTNLAVSGVHMVDLNGQAAKVAVKAQYVTILIGANDVCTESQGTMTDVATFRAQLDTALQTLTTRAPNAKIYILSIPDIYNLWDILKNNSSARSTWSLFGICQSMLANPLSTAQADIDRRNAVRQRNIDFNTQLQEACAQYTQCTFDNNAVFNTTFVTSDVSTRDYFHPSVAGQARLALTAWNASIFGP